MPSFCLTSANHNGSSASTVAVAVASPTKAGSSPTARMSSSAAADPEARATAEELISAVGLEPAFLGDATATQTVDALLPLWFALVKQSGGNRKVALRIVS